MERIVSPLTRNMEGLRVADLQDALQMCIDRGAILADDPNERQRFTSALRHERIRWKYGNITSDLVRVFQQEMDLTDSGEVDESTAEVLNALLTQWGVFDRLADPVTPQSYAVSGQVRREDGIALREIRVRAVHEADAGSVRLGEDLTDSEGRYTIRYDPLPETEAITLHVTAWDAEGRLLRDNDAIHGARPLEILDMVVPGADIQSYRVEGKVASRTNADVAGLRVAIVDKGVGGDMELAQATTDSRGFYQTAFSDSIARERGKTRPDLQARVFSDKTFLGASAIHFDVSPVVTLDVLLEDDKAAPALHAEYDVLTSALSAQFGGRLGDIQETDERQDITFLANKTGWDARAVALAALADQYSAQTAAASGGPAVPPAYFYALFRAGIPANEDTLYHTDAKTLERVWTKAGDQGVIPKTSPEQIQTAIGHFQNLSAQKLLTGQPLTGPSSLKDMLNTAKLTDAQQTKFAQLYTVKRDDMSGLWGAVASDPVFGSTPDQREQLVNRLQVDAKLGFLTINNAAMMQKLHARAGTSGLADPLQLAQTGHHRAAAWQEVLDKDVPIPSEIPGDTPEKRRENYANYLAAQTRLSYPTAVVAHMVKSGELPLGGAAKGAPDQVHAFLTEHQGRFEIGMQPVEQYIARNNVEADSEVVRQVKRLQRVYQITPNDQAMSTLLKHDIDAAYHVVRYDRDSFVQNFAGEMGGPEQAASTYDRSVQIHQTVLNIALGYLHARTSPAIGVHSPSSVLDPAPSHASDVIAYATLENVFGSMDFCACEHCRSILSPAAYLVDLQLFLNSDAAAWNGFLARWKTEHGNAPYPFANQAAWQKFQNDWNSQHPGQPLPDTQVSPFEVLMSRRPDIQHLPLTCDNTNTALPYVDVVNETLEYYVANGMTLQKNILDEYLGHDSGDIASEDLLASPQFVMDAAYAALLKECFPAPLPFHQPLENLRRYFKKFDVPLPLAMDRLRNTDALERGANAYGIRDILMEEAGLSREEYEILTDSVAVPLWRMYGFPPGTPDAAVISGLSNAKQYTRRTDISYEDLIAILRTRFVNPNGNLIPKLERLGMSFAMLKAFKDGAITDAQFDALLAGLAVPPDPAEYGGDIKAWVKNNDNYARIMSLITLAIPAGTWAPFNAYAIGACVRPTNPPPGSSLYYECTTAGMSAGAEPSWPTAPGNTYADGSVVWTCRDASSCHSFGNLAFRYSDPAKLTQNIGAIEFVRLLRFIRLWKKLNWTIDQTDATLCALDPPLDISAANDLVELDGIFLVLLPRLGIVLRVMKALDLNAQRDLRPLLTLWSDIDTHGPAALYRQMFLNPALLKQDAAFADNGYGEFLTDPNAKLANHGDAVRSSFDLTDDEYRAIVQALRYESATLLSIPNISAIYRHGWLARVLNLSVRELLLLIRLTGLNPFNAPDPAAPAILQLIALVNALQERSLKSAAALYLIWNQDLSGKSAPGPEQIVELARTLRGDFAAIDDQFAAIEDPNGDVARARMTLVYGQETSDAFFALLDDTLIIDTSYTHPSPTLEARILAADPRIGYDDFRHRLSHRGLMTAEMRSALRNLSGISAEFRSAVDALFARSEDTKGSFFGRNPELRSAYDEAAALEQTLVLHIDYTHSAETLEPAITAADSRIAYDNLNRRLSYSGVLTAARRDVLKNVAGVTPLFQSAMESLFALSRSVRSTAILGALQPGLSRRRKRQQAVQRLSAAASIAQEATQTMLDPASRPYPLHAAADQNRPVLDDVIALETAGLAVQFFFRDTATGPVDLNVAAAANLDYASGSDNPLPKPGNPVSGIWTGQIETPETGFYNIIIEADRGAKVTLTLGGHGRTLIRNGNVWRNIDPIELNAGTLHEIRLQVEKVQDVLRIQWETPVRPREVIPPRYLYPPSILAPFSHAYVRFLKAVSLMTGLSMTANELAFFATHTDYQVDGDGWLNALAVSGDPEPAIAIALRKPFEALLDFARIKSGISPDDESLLAVLKDPVAATENNDSLLFTLTRWNKVSLTDLLTHFGGNIANLSHFNLFLRMHEAFALLEPMGISAKALLRATTNAPAGGTVRELQSALSARYDAATWRDAVKPINDEMRGLQRDALVTHILHRMRTHPDSAHIDTPDKLFEYFLMDVQMDACMQTSRVRHALSSVQLFIERCLMNLEPRVSPAAINARQWEWMKRYRVWEANRKVYLFPENWLEPELRDDKSPFFKELESELLQGDVTEERAASALTNYLTKLEDVAKLEQCAVFYSPEDLAARTGEVSHVIARSVGARRKYYYRRKEYGYWTPWEQIKLDIEDNPVIPAVWNNRLFLFWLRIVKKAADTAQKPFSKEGYLTSLKTSDLKTSAPQMSVQAILCWSEYSNGVWQPIRTSDVDEPLELGKFSPHAFDRRKLRLSLLFWTKGALRVIVAYGTGVGSSFFLHNPYGTPELRQGKKEPHFSPKRTLGTTTESLKVTYVNSGVSHRVLTSAIRDSAVQPNHAVVGMAWDPPFFYQDARHAFHVTTTEKLVWLPGWHHFGVFLTPAMTAPDVPPLALQPAGIVADPAGPVSRQPGFGVVDPSPVEQFVSEDAYIHQAISTVGTVRYGEVDIGPAGSQIKSIRTR